MHNVPEHSDITYRLMLCKKHAQDFLYSKRAWINYFGTCGYGYCRENPNRMVYLAGQPSASSVTPKGKDDK
jgi:hypothetical protein